MWLLTAKLEEPLQARCACLTRTNLDKRSKRFSCTQECCQHSRCVLQDISIASACVVDKSPLCNARCSLMTKCHDQRLNCLLCWLCASSRSRLSRSQQSAECATHLLNDQQDIWVPSSCCQYSSDSFCWHCSGWHQRSDQAHTLTTVSLHLRVATVRPHGFGHEQQQPRCTGLVDTLQRMLTLKVLVEEVGQCAQGSICHL
mmetsp:Transcript_20566/g.48101  ORF Transcript_20566/g.48101 Transcript_20566/m.48101 type:complete len:201 (+) Transcript_20566:310-912(+)